MKNQIGFITIGQAGHNIGSVFEAAGFDVLHINTAETDLATLENSKYKHHIKNGEGCNKNRDKAKQLLKDDLDSTLAKIEQTLSQEYIFPIFSLGGGTGSGMGPMLTALLIEQLGKKTGAITVMPSEQEGIRTLANALECFTELELIDTEYNMCASFVLDNNRASADKFTLNNAFYKLFTSFLDIPAHHNANAKGNIDPAEVKEMIGTSGMAIISKLPKAKDNIPGIIESFRENIFAPPERDGRIKYLGISSPLLADMSIETLTESLVKETGQYFEVYSGVNTDNTICMFCGLSFPYTKLKALKDRAESSRDIIAKKMQKETRISKSKDLVLDLDLDSSNSSTSSSSAKNTQVEKANLSDILSKFMKKK